MKNPKTGELDVEVSELYRAECLRSTVNLVFMSLSLMYLAGPSGARRFDTARPWCV